eukprot:5263915-Prymnesium_polylepis.1
MPVCTSAEATQIARAKKKRVRCICGRRDGAMRETTGRQMPRRAAARRAHGAMRRRRADGHLAVGEANLDEEVP